MGLRDGWREGGGGLLLMNKLIGISHWMGSHLYDWIDYNRVAFSIQLQERGGNFKDFGDKKVLVNRKMEIFLVNFLYTSFRISMYNLIETYLKGFIR